MEKIYKKNELNFSLIWIGIYVLVLSFADSFSTDLGLYKSVTAPVTIVLTAVVYLLIRKLGIREKCGLCPVVGSPKRFLCFLPVLVLATSNLWNGVTMGRSPAETALHIISMLCVGFLEEIIFRGFLFNALLQKGSVLKAILIAGLTFGLGHIVNLLNGTASMSVVRQLAYASCLGVMLTVVFYTSKSLWPCILFHSFINSSSAFVVPGSEASEWVATLIICALSLAYSAWLWKTHKPSQKAEA